MQALPFDYELDQNVYLCHGSPTDDTVYLLENVETGQPIVRSDSDILSILNDIDKPIIICGHTHTPRMVKLSTGQIVINTGSVATLPILMTYLLSIRCKITLLMQAMLL